MLENLGFKKRTHVGISLSANNFIELVCVDRQTKEVVKYASGNIKYNNAIREIIDYDEFAEVISGLFDDAGLDPKECSVTLNMPNVHFGITTLESAADEPYLIENLQSEIEDLYIFKRNEPRISTSTLGGNGSKARKNIGFAAIQEKTVAKIVEIFDAMGLELVRIDNSYCSLIKAISFCERFNKHVEKGSKSLILLVTANSCCAFSLFENVLYDCTEEPIAVKSFSTEEVYAAISKLLTTAISKNKPDSILIISETDEVNAGTLSQKIDFEGEVDCFNKCLNINDQFIDVSGIGSDIDANMISYMTIEAVGAAVADYGDYPLDINFLPEDRIKKNMIEVGDYEIEFSRFAVTILLFSVIIALIILFAIRFTLDAVTKNVENRKESSSTQINVFRQEIQQAQGDNNKGSVIPYITNIVDNNREVINIYNALSTEIPESIYIKRYVTNVRGGIGILGEAKSSESVDSFVKSLREKNDKKNLMLSKLSINTEDGSASVKIPDGFTFEIKTTNTDVSLNEDMWRANDRNKGPANNYNMGPFPSSNFLAPPPSPVI